MQRFYIIQYIRFTAIAALVFALILGRPSQNSVLILGIFFLIGLSPIYLPLRPKSVQSVLLRLSENPDEQIAAFEGLLGRRTVFGSGPMRSASLRLMQAYMRKGY